MGLLTFPFQGLMFVFEEITKRAEDELDNQDGVRASLVELHKSLESGTISEADFDTQEAELLNKLMEIEARRKRRARRAAA
jgi:hypothetical protein